MGHFVNIKMNAPRPPPPTPPILQMSSTSPCGYSISEQKWMRIVLLHIRHHSHAGSLIPAIGIEARRQNGPQKAPQLKRSRGELMPEPSTKAASSAGRLTRRHPQHAFVFLRLKRKEAARRGLEKCRRLTAQRCRVGRKR